MTQVEDLKPGDYIEFTGSSWISAYGRGETRRVDHVCPKNQTIWFEGDSRTWWIGDEKKWGVEKIPNPSPDSCEPEQHTYWEKMHEDYEDENIDCGTDHEAGVCEQCQGYAQYAEPHKTRERRIKDLPDVPYYRFSKGVEVKDITAHLMSFPAQIVQYASRSGRVDGNCKSEETEIKIQDFKKVIDFAKWEIERLEGDS